MQQHWQKKPLLVPGALSDYADLLDRDGLMALSRRDDVVSRLVLRHGRQWEVRHGPFTRSELQRLPASGWSLLVQGVDQVLPRASRLLREFAFLPYARLDDVMVSFAPRNGGVGPHFDSYDVFLLQGAGQRRWQISAQRDLALVPGAPLRVLRRFSPTREWTVGPGDLLYLPPRYAHDGVALADCLTVSIGFRAPSTAELTARFLDHLQDTLAPEGIYTDPELRPVARPAALDARMVGKFAAMLKAIHWTRADVVEFAGRYLTEPKQHIVFQHPIRPLSVRGFAQAIGKQGVQLALGTAMLFHRQTFYINGEGHCATGAAISVLRELADRRCLLPPLKIDAAGVALLYEWYRAGYLSPGGAEA